MKTITSTTTKTQAKAAVPVVLPIFVSVFLPYLLPRVFHFGFFHFRSRFLSACQGAYLPICVLCLRVFDVGRLPGFRSYTSFARPLPQPEASPSPTVTTQQTQTQTHDCLHDRRQDHRMENHITTWGCRCRHQFSRRRRHQQRCCTKLCMSPKSIYRRGALQSLGVVLMLMLVLVAVRMVVLGKT